MKKIQNVCLLLQLQHLPECTHIIDLLILMHHEKIC